MFKVSLSDGLAIAGAILTLILVVLDKAGRLKGPMLLVLLAFAAVLTLPLALSNSWVVGAADGMLRLSRGLVVIFAVGLVYSLVAVWVSSGSAEERKGTGIPLTSKPTLLLKEMTLNPPAGDIQLTFKSSPVFSKKNKQRITSDITKCRSYLIKLGIPVPIEPPPIGTRKRTGKNDITATQISTPPGLPAYQGNLIIEEELVRDSMRVTGLYCDHTMGMFFFAPDSPLGPSYGEMPKNNLANIMKAIAIQRWLSAYLNTSFWNKAQRRPFELQVFLAGALWDIREKFGQDFADRLVGYTFRAMMDGPTKSQTEDVDSYFMSKLKIGASVLDNDGSRWPEIEGIVRKHGLLSKAEGGQNSQR